ncbi:hypothetical protein AMTRI_Chr10g231860 [Amborella trichopoda]
MPERRTTMRRSESVGRRVLENLDRIPSCKRIGQSENSSPSQSDLEASFSPRRFLKVYPNEFRRSNYSVSLSTPPQTTRHLPQNGLKKSFQGHKSIRKEEFVEDVGNGNSGFKRCHWITRGSDPLYIKFHDEQWGVPVYDDNLLFELLSLSGMLSEQSWTDILGKREQYREIFLGFDVNMIALMDATKQVPVFDSENKTPLSEIRLRCIIENAKSVVKIVKEFGSFSAYLWSYVNYTPIINKYRYGRNVPWRTPRSELVSNDLVRRGFRFVGPTIIYAFMQASGMTVDHLVECFRFHECVSLALMC